VTDEKRRSNRRRLDGAAVNSVRITMRRETGSTFRMRQVQFHPTGPAPALVADDQQEHGGDGGDEDALAPQRRWMCPDALR
jgi:uncharacterized DUF497 family protein